jgi:GWxTD domain-containing protein
MTFAGTLNDEAQLNEYIEALAPIANEVERRDIYDIINRPGLEEKQLFLYKFWARREPLNAEGAWRQYKTRIDYVEKNFSWPKTKGIHTDRGRVYLQYGAPDYVRDEKNFVSMRNMGGGVTIIRSDEAVGLEDHQVARQGQIFYLPYQLWRYNNLPGDDANRCFIFWDEFRSGFYKLLHSNAKGEVRDMFWERRLSQLQLEEGVQGEVGDQFERGY